MTKRSCKSLHLRSWKQTFDTFCYENSWQPIFLILYNCQTEKDKMYTCPLIPFLKINLEQSNSTVLYCDTILILTQGRVFHCRIFCLSVANAPHTSSTAYSFTILLWLSFLSISNSLIWTSWGRL